ncbi:PREDICTED: uncharacterized protein LOC104607935 [Nelumbo nucifera]|uniref:Uncharacterized protein LOC104607935 n=1 Tax=Nelumbo nucifera TaxID=4432 RepID=A0A1U8AZ37_NELNU|nr:PREDICTED: uncharacterized protein LOC104607935 [Nelumbo nucifera]
MASKAVAVELSRTEKLNGTNYPIWKRRIRQILAQDCLDYILDDDIPPVPSENATLAETRKHNKYEKDNKIARSTILTFIELDIEMLFEEYKYAKNMFDAVTETCGKVTESYIQLLIEKFYGFAIKEDDPIVENVNKMIVIAKELAAVGNSIPDKVQLSTILHSLPKSWEQVAISLNLSGQNITMQNLPMLLAVEAKRRNKKNNSQALVTKPTPSEPTKSSEKPKPKFQKGKGKWFKKTNFNKGKKNVICFNFGAPGNTKYNCSKKKQNPGTNTKDIICVVSESFIVDSDSSSWWIDSGSSQHVARSKEAFLDLKEMQPG